MKSLLETFNLVSVLFDFKACRSFRNPSEVKLFLEMSRIIKETLFSLRDKERSIRLLLVSFVLERQSS